MEIYLIFVVILFVLASADLIVGVSNDAVNFLNSAIGSKVAPRHIILLVASAGIVAGTTFSSGMMEVARKGIFNPEMFYFHEVMAIFLGVMFTDIILLDFFNTFGLPTSTTVSLISELLGGSVAISIIKISSAGQTLNQIENYINSSRALGIFTAILSSIVISFFVGAVVMYLSRLIFTFDYRKTIKRYGAVWGSLALTSITYFILIKGARGTSFLSKETVEWISNHSLFMLIINFGFWAVVLQLLLLFTKIDILKPIVLAGTFSLALAFAANDLVNFIGVPLAGLSSYEIASNSGDPFNISMVRLTDPVQTNTLVLLIAGLIMAVTLWISRKARTVTKTEVNLGRQYDGYERFESFGIAKNFVRLSINFKKTIDRIIPQKFRKFLDNRFDTTKIDFSNYPKKERPSFDLLRASVNLMVASSLISVGTAYKLPLSTTYVTFIVAMASSLSDRAWGRESAVYRVSGVFTVIVGWFFTAFIAFTVSAIVASTIYYGGIYSVLGIGLIVVFIIFRSNFIHKRKEKKEARLESLGFADEKTTLLDNLVDDVKQFLSNAHNIYDNVYGGLVNENRKKLKKAVKESKELDEHGSVIMGKLLHGAVLIDDAFTNDNIKLGRTVSSIRDISASLRDISKMCFEHVDNNHSGLAKDQKEDFKELKNLITSEFDLVASKFSKKDLSKLEDLQDKILDIRKSISKLDRNQVVRIKNGETKVRTNILFMNILFKTEQISTNVSEIINFNKELLKKKA
ncbi:MAG: inorganic phosphate transporter [Bacteroidota bacterium]